MNIAMKNVCSRAGRWLTWWAVLTFAGGMVASCDTPLGRAPDLQGSYWQNAIVTNPNGGGPEVVRWGPPQNYNPDAQNN